MVFLVAPKADSCQHGEPQNGSYSDLILQNLMMLGQRLVALEEKVMEIHQTIMDQRVQKEWYSTSEVAEALDKSHYTVQERWCNDGRIECEKDPNSGKWRIPGHEFQRLVGGGTLKPKRR
jgi:hypothetical protein